MYNPEPDAYAVGGSSRERVHSLKRALHCALLFGLGKNWKTVGIFWPSEPDLSPGLFVRSLMTNTAITKVFGLVWPLLYPQHILLARSAKSGLAFTGGGGGLCL